MHLLGIRFCCWSLQSAGYSLLYLYFSFSCQVLLTLGTEVHRPSSAAQCIAGIACTELPAELWPELLPQLVSNVLNPAQDTDLLKESSLEAIGYICQDIVSAIRKILYGRNSLRFCCPDSQKFHAMNLNHDIKFCNPQRFLRWRCPSVTIFILDSNVTIVKWNRIVKFYVSL